MLDAQLEILVLAAQSGEANAMASLYRHFFLPMRKYAVLRVSDVMVADDMVQNVWLKVAKRIRILNDVSLFRSWLYKALRWEIVDWQRKTSKEVVTHEFVETAAGHAENVGSGCSVECLKQLASDERDIAELYYISDLSVREISLIVGIPQGTVKSRLSRAREQLRRLLTDAS